MSSGLTDPNDTLLPEVEQRAALLRDLLRQSGWKVTAEVANAALAHLGIPRSTLFRAVARFRRTRRASSLLPLKRGTRDGSSLLDPRIERIIEEQIERFWLKKEKASIQRAHGTRSRRLPRRRFAGATSKNNQTPRGGPKSVGGGPPKRAGGFGGGVYPKPRPVCRRPS